MRQARLPSSPWAFASLVGKATVFFTLVVVAPGVVAWALPGTPGALREGLSLAVEAFSLVVLAVLAVCVAVALVEWLARGVGWTVSRWLA